MMPDTVRYYSHPQTYLSKVSRLSVMSILAALLVVSEYVNSMKAKITVIDPAYAL